MIDRLLEAHHERESLIHGVRFLRNRQQVLWLQKDKLLKSGECWQGELDALEYGFQVLGNAVGHLLRRMAAEPGGPARSFPAAV